MNELAKPLSSPASLVLGTLALCGVGATIVLGLFVTGGDVVQGEVVRMIYIHPALAWVTYLAFGITAFGSAAALLRRDNAARWDRLAGASAEVGVIFCALTIITGSIWGRTTWGVWWTWDARLTTTAVLLVMEIGYLALRRVPGSQAARIKRNAICGLVAFVNVPLVHLSVDWWRTLHQGRTLLRPDPQIEGLQLFTMLLGFASLTLVFAWLCIRRVRLAQLEERRDAAILQAAITERRAEALTHNPEIDLRADSVSEGGRR